MAVRLVNNSGLVGSIAVLLGEVAGAAGEGIEGAVFEGEGIEGARIDVSGGAIFAGKMGGCPVETANPHSAINDAVIADPNVRNTDSSEGIGWGRGRTLTKQKNPCKGPEVK